MIDVNFIRENPEKTKEGIIKKRGDPKIIAKFLRVDEDWRLKTEAVNQLKTEQNSISKELSRGQKPDLINRAQLLKKRIAELLRELEKLEEKRGEILEKIPNMPFDSVPVGSDESSNVEIRRVGKIPVFDFSPKDYLSIAERLKIIDVKKASEVSGSRFGYLLRDGALLEFALLKLALDVALPEGFIPVVPPVMIRPGVYKGIGRLASDQKNERYHIEKDDIYLIGSAEHTLVPIHMNETLEEKELPKRYIGFSTCFRREAGSYGKDTRGILRVHQFNKVEFVSFVPPEKSEEELNFLLSLQETLMKKIELPYRVVEICTGDMGWTDARQFDIEVWFPSEGKFRETHSCSNTTDFQTRGVGTKIKRDGKKEFAHSLNATAFSQRPILAIIENFQTKDGEVRIPKILQKYIGKEKISTRQE